MVHKFPLHFAPGGEDRTIHLYLPPGYETSDERYPVIYMFDGHNLFSDADATYGKSWALADFLDRWSKSIIVVGVECSHHGHERLSEYSPYDFKMRKVGPIRGRGPETMAWYVDTLKPYIDRHYRTWPHREATAVAGSSMGGVMALYALLRHNDVFSKAAVVSPAFFDRLPLYLDELKANVINPDTRLFMSWGTGEDPRGWMTKRIYRLETAVQQRGVRTWLYHQMGGQHCEADWERQVPTWVEFLFGR